MVFTSTIENVVKNNYKVFVKCPTSTSFTTYVEVGACASEPMLNEVKGEERAISDGTVPVVSKEVNVEFTVLNVTKANRSALLELINKPSTIVLVPEVNGAFATPIDTPNANGLEWRVTGQLVFPETTIKGQAVNEFKVSGKREVRPTDTTALTAGT